MIACFGLWVWYMCTVLCPCLCTCIITCVLILASRFTSCSWRFEKDWRGTQCSFTCDTCVHVHVLLTFHLHNAKTWISLVNLKNVSYMYTVLISGNCRIKFLHYDLWLDLIDLLSFVVRWRGVAVYIVVCALRTSILITGAQFERLAWAHARAGCTSCDTIQLPPLSRWEYKIP